MLFKLEPIPGRSVVGIICRISTPWTRSWQWSGAVESVTETVITMRCHCVWRSWHTAYI